MRNFLFALIALCLAPLVEVKAQALRFNARGEFKIVQFTDLHYRLDDPRSDAALQCITDVLAKSKGSSNPHNLVKATIAALDEMRSPAIVAQNRGISVEQVFKG